MKISLALAIIATVAQGLLVIAAPSKGKVRSGPPAIPPKVNYDKYYEAIMRANNLTDADVTPSAFGYGAERAKDQISTRAAPNTSTKIFCVGIAKKPARTYIFSDVHGCNGNGWTQAYSFISFMHKGPHAPTPWAACPASQWGVGIIYDTKCPAGSAGPAAVGYSSHRHSGHESFIYHTTDGYMSMGPFQIPDFTDSGRRYSLVGTIRHVGLLMVPSQADINFITSHVNAHPHLYKRISEHNIFNANEMLAAQLLIQNLGAVYLRRANGVINLEPGDGFGVDLSLHPELRYLRYRFVVQVREAVRESDGVYRHAISMYFHSDTGRSHWMGGITAPTDHTLVGPLLRSSLAEAIRDHTTVRADQGPAGNYMFMPLPPTGPAPPIPPMYSGYSG